MDVTYTLQTGRYMRDCRRVVSWALHTLRYIRYIRCVGRYIRYIRYVQEGRFVDDNGEEAWPVEEALARLCRGTMRRRSARAFGPLCERIEALLSQRMLADAGGGKKGKKPGKKNKGPAASPQLSTSMAIQYIQATAGCCSHLLSLGSHPQLSRPH